MSNRSQRLGSDSPGAQAVDDEVPLAIDAELPSGWADRLHVDTIDYLYEESRKRLLEQRSEIEALKAKAPAIAGFATVVMIATGILGDLRISFGDDLVVSTLFVVALAAFVCVLASAGVVIWPRPMRTGVNPEWLGGYAMRQANPTRLRAAAVEAQIDAFSRNRGVYERDRRIINGMMLSAALETVAIVALVVVRVWPNLG